MLFTSDNKHLEAPDTSTHLIHTVYISYSPSQSLMALLILMYTELELEQKQDVQNERSKTSNKRDSVAVTLEL